MMITVRAVVLAPIWGAALAAIGIYAAAIGPELEENLFPVIVDQQIAAVTRSTTAVCWNWTYTKARGLTYLSNVYVMERDDGVRFPVSQYRADLGIPTNDSTTAAAGVRRTVPECVSMPPALIADKHVRVLGRNIYQSLLWQVEQTTAAIDVGQSPPPPTN